MLMIKRNHCSRTRKRHDDIHSFVVRWLIAVLLIPVAAPFRPSPVTLGPWRSLRHCRPLLHDRVGVLDSRRIHRNNNKKKECLLYVKPESSFLSIQNEDEDFVQFVDRQRLRDIIKNTAVFKDLSKVELETIVQTFELVRYNDPNDFVFRKGDQGDGMYIVKSGRIDIVSDDSGMGAITTYSTGDLFGELALLFDEPRAASARIVDKETELWKLSKQDFHAISQNNANKVSKKAKQSVILDPKYAQYLETIALKSAMQQCPIFRGFESKDLDRCVDSMDLVTYMNGDVIIQQGDSGNAMYFVKSGTGTCIDEKSGKVVAEIEAGGYFGELALLFNQPRAVTVRATGDNVAVWRLPADKFFEAVQEYSLSEKALELLQEKYGESSLWSTLQKASLEEIFDLIRNASRPKKKNVTIHSIISSIYAGLFLVAYLPQFHPTWHNAVGSPQLFSPFDLSDTTIFQYRLGSFMAVVVALLGVFRIPKNAPECRKNYFTAMLWACASLWTLGDSNSQGATTDYTFDMFSPFGAACIVVPNVIGGYWALKCVDDAITSPRKGRETLPLVSSRWSGALVQTFFFFLIYVQMDTVFWSVYDRQGFEDIALPFYRLGYERYALVGAFTVNGLQAFGALFGTLLYEKKISAVTATFLNTSLLLMILGDQWSSIFMDRSTPQYQAVVPVYEWMSQYRVEFHSLWILVGILLLTIANAFRRRIAMGITD